MHRLNTEMMRLRLVPPPSASRLRRYGVAVLVTSLAMALNVPLERWFLSMVLPASFTILLSSWYGGLGPGLLSTLLCIVAWKYFWIAPRHLVGLPAALSWINIVLFALVGAATSLLTDAMRHARRREHQARLAAEQSASRIARLQALTAALSRALTPEEVADAIIQHGGTTMAAISVTLAVLSDDGKEIVIVGATGLPPQVHETYRRVPVASSGPIIDAIRTRAPVLVESWAALCERFPMLKATPVPGVEATACLPLHTAGEGRTLGGLGLGFPHIRAFSPDEVDFLQTLAQQCAQALERTGLYETERRAHAEAVAAARLKEEFLGTVSHELRTPLTSILGWTSLIRTGTLSDREMARAHEVIHRNARAQVQLIDDLLDVSRIVSGALRLERHALEMATVVEATLDTARPAATAKGQRFEVTVDPGVGTIFGDSARLQQVVWNLLFNAIKFTPEGGLIRVLLSRAPDGLELLVSDTGIGITADYLPHVFERFSQAEGTSTRRFGGLGLGLAIVRHLVELHGGQVTAESDGAGRGATFRVRLPVGAPAGAAPKVRHVDPSVDLLNGVRVLVVDDVLDSRDVLAALLECTGASVAKAASAEEAMVHLQGAAPDVMLVDIGMPVEDGYSLIQRVRALPPERGGQAPAVALTGYAGDEDRQRALAAGFQCHMAKPVKHQHLVQVVAALAGRGLRAQGLAAQ